MTLKLYNSYTRRKEVFRPLKDRVVAMYNCGPTVYDYVHIGNLRSFLLADVLRRYLEYRGYRVKQVMNITDVGHMVSDADAGEDKMALAVRREKKGPQEVARFYEEKFFEDIKSLGFKPAWKYPRASEHVGEMVKMVKKLLKKGHAYLVPESPSSGLRPPSPTLTLPSPLGRGDGGEGRGQGEGHSVYYDLSTFPRWGKLSGNKLDDLIPGARVEVIHEKRQPYDFALWIYKPNHVLQWPSPWGKGYPGWHLECSAMARKYLGATLDIHTGGEDNKFPHHECEIAQSEGATGKKFVRYWLHVKHLLVEGKKMSKSLGNFYTLRDLVNMRRPSLRDHGDSVSLYRAIRYALIAAHYRETLNFTIAGLKSAASALQRVDELVDKLQQKNVAQTFRSEHIRAKALSYKALHLSVVKARHDFIAAMDDDLNVPKALAAVFELVRKVNSHVSRITYHVSRKEVNEILSLFKEFDAVLGLGIGAKKKTAVPAEVRKLVAEREEARKRKDWARADELRTEIKKHGFAVEDTREGPLVKRSSDL